MYLLDTDVLSATRKLPAGHGAVEWLAAQTPALYLSTITVMEIERGIEQQRGIDPTFARDLETWLAAVLLTFDERVLFVTTRVAQRWGRLQIQLQRTDNDVAIAAIALEHGFSVVTRNVRHFDKTGAQVLNPFDLP
jgi:predicted nucleic acid-binding protein